MQHGAVVIGTRAWEYVLPLAFADVPVSRDLDYRRLPATPDHWAEPEYDIAETSFSRYVRARAAGDDRVIALPVFIMRAFRHRCILVTEDSDIVDPTQLRGARVGLTGWPDSGNVWTRAVLQDAGVGIDEVQWQVGRLTEEHPHADRLGGVVPAAPVDQLREGSLVGELAAGRLDAVMSPFMPPGFHTDGALRALFLDVHRAERQYYQRHGFIPGMHLLTVRADTLEQDPDLGQVAVDAFEAAKHQANGLRSKLVDVLPWHNLELARTVETFGADWQPSGVAANTAMITEFQRQLQVQGLLDEPVPLEVLFPDAHEPAETVAPTPSRAQEAS